MSRKREKQRESRRELARQLGVDPDEVPDELRSHARVCEPEVVVSLRVDQARRGLLARALPTDVHAALMVVDAAGPRLARAQHLRGLVSRTPGDAPLAPVTPEQGEPKIRYTRPGHFLLLLLTTEGATDEEARAHARALAAIDDLLLEAGARRGRILDVTSPALEQPTQARVLCGPSTTPGPLATGAALRFVAAAVLRVPAAHRVEQEVTLPLASDDGRFTAQARVRLRL